jgi:hypothetical protein
MISSRPAIGVAGCVGACRLPKVTKVAGLAAIRPAFLSPMIARNRPMPAEIASFCERGIALMIHSRNLNRLTSTISRPEMNTAPSAACHA